MSNEMHNPYGEGDDAEAALDDFIKTITMMAINTVVGFLPFTCEIASHVEDESMFRATLVGFLEDKLHRLTCFGLLTEDKITLISRIES